MKRKPLTHAARLLCALALSMSLAPAALAADPSEPTQPSPCYPTAVTRSEDGTEIRKMYDLGPEDDPGGIPRSDFEQDGYHYTLTDLLKQELPANESRQHTETVSVNSKSKDMGAVLALLTGLCIFGGVRRISAITSGIVPVMAAIYIALGLFITVKNIGQVPYMLSMIVSQAFDPKAMFAGIGASCIMQGIKRGLYSNEAGMGSAPNAAAAADVSHPVKQGLVQMLSVFIDTILICSTTAFMLLLSGVPIDAYSEGMNFVQAAVHSQVGPFGPLFITVSIFLFAFSSLVGNYYYTESNFRFIRDSKTGLLVFRLTCVAAIFIGAQMSFSMVWDLADVLMGLMALVNLVAILLLGGKAIRVLKDYQKQRRAGKNPVYRYDEVGVGSPEIWNEAHAKKWED